LHGADLFKEGSKAMDDLVVATGLSADTIMKLAGAVGTYDRAVKENEIQNRAFATSAIGGLAK
jgi:hypothetical protein